MDWSLAGSSERPRQPIIELDQASCGYQGTTVLHDVTLQIFEGQLTGLVGPSGAGKTTLLRTILGQVPLQRGRVRVMGDLVGREPPKGVGYVPQLEAINWHFPVTVEEVVLMGRAVGGGPWPWPRREDRESMAQLLDRLGMYPYRHRHIRELSGGQQQRAFLARALMRSPRLLILDEPTTGVDIKTRHDILHLLHELNAGGVTIVLTTHDLNAVATHLPDVVCLNHTVVAQGHPQEIFTPDILGRTYGAEMLVLRQDNLIVVADRLTAERETPKEAQTPQLIPVP
ncbi:MAG TPA: metal ABC transporter ATP-binding protein [Chloroflexota bacterium]|nr:metal ABC transporter ATP-binding protein [Chloroflexota bacterium]